MEHSPRIIFEDEMVIAIDKPAGLLVHGDGKSTAPTLADWVVGLYPNLEQVGEPWTTPEGRSIPRPGIVHRLDRETSGIMIIAKTPESFSFLKEAFQERRVHKTYRAFVYGACKEREGEIDRPIGKSKSDFRKWSAQPGSRGVQRAAHTAWKVISEVQDERERYTYLELTPTTGRTHQLRVHLKAIHHPIVCDALYAPNRECALGFSRLALHAHTLSYGAADGSHYDFEAPLPPDFIAALEGH